MNRRHFLATAGLVALAGCSDGGDPSAAAVPPTGGDNSTEGNQTNNGSDVDPPASPTDPELAAEHIADAQAAIQAAIDGIRAEIGFDSGLADLDASVSIDTSTIGAELSNTRDAIEAAREYDMSDSQQRVARSIENVEPFVRAVVNVQPSLHTLYKAVRSLLQDAKAGDWEGVDASTRDVETALGDVDVGSVEAGTISGNQEGALEDVEATEPGDIEAQIERVRDEVDTARAILDALGPLEEAGATFSEADNNRDEYGWGKLVELFNEAAALYGEVASVSGGHGLSPGVGWLSCYAGKMERAATKHRNSVQAYHNNEEWWYEEREEARQLEEEAVACELSM